MSDPDIKILVSCHKDIVAPQSNVFLPIHVGAASTSKSLNGMQPDNVGENISERNFTFCELTAQYWAWKNLEADYYGLCHYRRYFCFDGKKHSANDHKQIEVKNLSNYSLQKYRLDDEKLITSIVAQYDLIVPPYWNVKGAPTPDGPKKTIKDHMIGYGLIDEDSVELLINITKRNQPNYYDDLIAYLEGHDYLGYNCYIMKKELFSQLCEFEFSILLDFDKEFDYSNRTTTQKRICGYLGEILFSVFVNSLSKHEDVKIAHYPLVFFDETMPSYPVAIANNKSDNDPIDVIWRYREDVPEALAVGISSFFKFVNPNKRYRLTVLVDNPEIVRALNDLLISRPSNVVFVQSTWENVSFNSCDFLPEEDDLNQILPFLLPWMSTNFANKVLWLDGLFLFNDDPAAITESANNTIECNNCIIAERELNKPQNNKCSEVLKKYTNSYTKLGTAVMVLNLEQIKKKYTPEKIIKLYRSIYSAFGALNLAKPKTNRYPLEIPVSVLAAQSALLSFFEGVPLDIKYATQSINMSETQTWTSEETFKIWKSVSGNASIIDYRPENTPYIFPDPVFSSKFWNMSREAGCYEMLLSVMMHKKEKRLVDLLLPEGSFGRRAIRKLISLLRH